MRHGLSPWAKPLFASKDRFGFISAGGRWFLQEHCASSAHSTQSGQPSNGRSCQLLATAGVVPGQLCGSIAAHERRQQLRPLWQQLPHWIGVLHGWVLRLRGRIHALPRGMRGFLFLFQRQFKLRQLRELVLDWRELLWRDLSQEYLIVATSFVPGWVRVICESGDQNPHPGYSG